MLEARAASASPVLALGLWAACVACGPDTTPVEPTPGPPSFERIMVDPASGQLVTGGGEPFRVWGYNYTTDRHDRLIEERWTDESEWSVLAEDLAEMRGYGANVVRLHLQFHEFMMDPSTPDPAALLRLERLVRLAAQSGLYVDLTGLAAYRKSDQPAWYDGLSDAARWSAQAVFWEAVARTTADHANVFVLNLMNEPVATPGPGAEWLPGEGFGGFHFIQNIVRTPDSRTQAEVIRDWISVQRAAVRRGSPQALVTVGFLPLGDLVRFSDDLDVLATHIYPRAGATDEAVEYTRANVGAKPLLIEEIAALHAGTPEVVAYMDAVDPDVVGFLAHYMGKTAEELAADGTLTSALQRQFLLAFSARSPVAP